MHEPAYKKPRIGWLDTFRGIAIILMVIFHFCYDLTYFGWYDANVGGKSAWLPFRYLILTMFVSLMGISINLAYASRSNIKQYSRWLVKLFAAAGLVTVGTYFVFPTSWVFFGVLHFMAVASIVVYALKDLRFVSFILGISIVLVNLTDFLPYGWPITYIRHLFHEGRSVDYVPLIPWLGVALIGSSLSQFVTGVPCLERIETSLPKILQTLGRHSMVIYLLHQPVLLGALYCVKYFV